MLSAAVVLIAAVVVGLIVAFHHTGSTSTGGAQPPLTTLAIPTSHTLRLQHRETTPDTTSNDTRRIATTAATRLSLQRQLRRLRRARRGI